MTLDDAQACWAILASKEGAADPRSWGEQFVELKRVLRSGAPRERAEKIHSIYRRAGPLDDSQAKLLKELEDAFFPELGEALNKKPKAMKQVLHREQPAFEGPQAPAAVEPP